MSKQQKEKGPGQQPGPLVVVDWIDSCSPSRKWQDREGMKGYGASMCRSAGYLMEDRKDTIVLAASYGGSEVGDCTAIPRVAVRRMRRLR